MGSSIHHGAGEMCLEAAAAGGRSRRGGKKQAASAAAAAEQQKVPKQPQRGLGVAQLEKIRMQNQMTAAASPFQPSSYLTGCFETMDHRRIAADVQYGQYYAENLLPYGSSRPPATSPLYVVVHDAKDSSPPSGYMQHTPQYDYWAARSSGGHELSGGAGSTEELDLELRL